MAQRYTPYGGLIEHHLRIGDTEFYVPPTAISVHRQMKNKRAQILRARNSLPKESGYFDKVIEFTLFFPNMDSINMELRPLLAQVKKCPFLPVENTYLNDIQKVDAITIAGITVQTTPGFPHTLQAQIQCYAFEPFSYIADDEDRTFDEMFDWPLFRWYYSRNLDPQSGNGFHTYYEPIYFDLDNSFRFRIAAEEDLEAIKNWKDKKKKLIKDYIDAKKDHFWGNEIREETFDKEYYDLYQNAMFEYDIHYDDYDIPGLILTDFSVGFENAITSLQILEDESPTHQYMGSQDTIISARFTADEEALASLEGMVRRSTYLIRTYHKELANGFLELDHQLARLFGVKNVTIEDMQTNTVEGQPGLYEVTLTMVAYNRIEKKLNEVQWLSQTTEWDIDKYEDQGFWSLITAPIPSMPGEWTENATTGMDYASGDWYKNNFLYRWGRFMTDRPAMQDLMSGMKTFLGWQSKTEGQLTEDGIKQAIYDESVRQIFRSSEIYPDLELPTYGEVAAAGFHIENTSNGIFVDPDFFIKYKKGLMFWEVLLDSIQKNHQIKLRDGTGGEATADGGEITDTNEVVNEQNKKNQEEYKQASEKNQINYETVAQELIDPGNISKSDMEVLIREKAKEFGVNQNFALSFAKVMDEELKQFYEKGTNAKQGKVVNSNTSSPVMMNNDFKFFTNHDGSIDGEYIGVMKVRRMYGSNVNMLGKNIEYNVESGIRKMADFYADLERIHAASATGTKKLYNEQYVYEAFGLKQNESEKARFAGVLMFYLGLDREYTDLVKDNKKPPTRIINLIKNVLNQANAGDQWSAEQIQNKAKSLPIKDFKTVGTQANSVSSNMSTKNWDDNNKVHQGMMHDMLRYDMRGRLVRAFPTFFLALIDEGQYIGTVKLSDQFFNYQAVMDIMYTNSRKDASSTLVLEMANIYGTLDDAEKDMDLTNTSFREVLKTMTMPGAVAREAERSRHRHPNYYKSIMLRTGTRIHFKMGYGSNVMNMPTIMNGTITSIQNNGESLTVIAQDDGIELSNKIRADVNETTDGGFLHNKQEPTEIVDEILTDSQGFFKNMWAGLSNKEFEHHSLGIMHFGSQQKPQGWAELDSFFGGAWQGAAGGALGGLAAGGPIGAAIGLVGGAVGGGLMSGVLAGKDARTMGEINMNVYQTTGLTNEEHDKWWNQVKDAFGIGKADEDGININLFDKSAWDVMNICASMGDDHIVAVHPFGFRNTVFSGKTYFPLHYDYIVADGEVKGTAVKPFRQFHVYDSVTNILDNCIEVTEDNMKTVAVGVYMNEGEMDTTSPIYVDTNIWPEKQRTVNIDTSMNAMGTRLFNNPIANLPIVNLASGLLNKPFKWHYDEGVAVKIAARGLSDYVRDMYDGYLTVMGDPSVKPYDQAWIGDMYNSISGPVDVKEVTQIMNHQTGFITMIKPDAVVVNTDRRSMTFGAAMQMTAGAAAATFFLRKKLRTSKYAGNLPIMNALWASTRNSFDRMKQRYDSSKVKTKLIDKLTGKKPPNESNVIDLDAYRKGKKGSSSTKTINRWSKSGMLEQLQKLVGSEAGDNLKNILQQSKQFGYNSVQNIKLKSKAAGFIAKGARHLPKILKGVKAGAALIALGSGPIGWIAAAIEMIAVEILAASIGEFINRWLFMRQACLISPLQKSGLEFTAGINGHKGSVVGDPPDAWQSILTNDLSAFFLGFLGANTSQFSQEAREGAAQSKASSGLNVDISQVANSFFSQYRKPVRSIENLEKLYDDDRKASLEQVNKRLELLNRRDTKAVYEKEETTWDEWVDKIGDKISGWFSKLWDKVKGMFGSGTGDQVCVPKGDVPTSGKAKGLSKYFDVIGPKIEKEAKAQGLQAYAEIIKAKCMQESGGNYVKYPDVMQASESMGKPIGYIKDVDLSIKQGVSYFGQIIKKTNGDIKLALQSYNFGSGFIDYVMKRGGKYTKELAYQFAEYMVQKMGKKISRIEPGYGDSGYVDRVLRYYDGSLPSGECEGGSSVTGGANSCPSVVGAAGKAKYRTSTGNELVDLKTISQAPFGIVIVGGTSKVRPGTAEALVSALKSYGTKVNITSGWRPGDPNWHGTGWAVDIDTPNTMRTINGKMRFPDGNDKNNARRLVDCCIQAGFRALYFGDWDIVQEMNNKYGSGTVTYDPAEHWNHLHCSYPICKVVPKGPGGNQEVK